MARGDDEAEQNQKNVIVNVLVEHERGADRNEQRNEYRAGELEPCLIFVEHSEQGVVAKGYGDRERLVHLPKVNLFGDLSLFEDLFSRPVSAFSQLVLS